MLQEIICNKHTRKLLMNQRVMNKNIDNILLIIYKNIKRHNVSQFIYCWKISSSYDSLFNLISYFLTPCTRILFLRVLHLVTCWKKVDTICKESIRSNQKFITFCSRCLKNKTYEERYEVFEQRKYFFQGCLFKDWYFLSYLKRLYVRQYNK